jgi:hypothetical protein
MFFDATFTFYTTHTMNFISSMKSSEFWISIDIQKAAVLDSETRKQVSPQVEELMLIHGPMPPGAVSFPAHDFFNLTEEGRGRVAEGVPNYGYGLIMAIFGNDVLVQYRNARRRLRKQDILARYASFVTDLSYAPRVDPALLHRFAAMRL